MSEFQTRANTFLSKEELKENVSAIYAKQPSSHLTSRYIFTPTSEIVDSFEKVNWFPTKAMGIKCSKKDPEFMKHSVRFAPKDHLFKSVNDLRPEIIIINSHNGTSALTAELGIHRLACANGLVVSDSNFGQMKWRHSKIDFETVQRMIIEALKEFDVLYNKIDEYKTINLSKEDQLSFAEKTIDMVWNGQIFEPDFLLNSRRQEDYSDNLFTVMNRIQENVMKGGIHYKKDNSEIHKHVRGTTRRIRNIDKDFKINTFLWAMMESFRVNKKF